MYRNDNNNNTFNNNISLNSFQHQFLKLGRRKVVLVAWEPKKPGFITCEDMTRDLTRF